VAYVLGFLVVGDRGFRAFIAYLLILDLSVSHPCIRRAGPAAGARTTTRTPRRPPQTSTRTTHGHSQGATHRPTRTHHAAAMAHPVAATSDRTGARGLNGPSCPGRRGEIPRPITQVRDNRNPPTRPQRRVDFGPPDPLRAAHWFCTTSRPSGARRQQQLTVVKGTVNDFPEALQVQLPACRVQPASPTHVRAPGLRCKLWKCN
jgi:hypothetical protein